MQTRKHEKNYRLGAANVQRSNKQAESTRSRAKAKCGLCEGEPAGLWWWLKGSGQSTVQVLWRGSHPGWSHVHSKLGTGATGRITTLRFWQCTWHAGQGNPPRIQAINSALMPNTANIGNLCCVGKWVHYNKIERHYSKYFSIFRAAKMERQCISPQYPHQNQVISSHVIIENNFVVRLMIMR